MPEGYAPGSYQRKNYGEPPESLLDCCDVCGREWSDHTERQLVRCSTTPLKH